MVTLMPRTAEPEALAEVRQGGALRSESELAHLFRVIRQRRTNRRPFLDTPVPDRHRHALEAAVRAEGCWLHAVRNSERRPLEELMRRAHREQMADPEFRAEWSRWTGLPEGAAVGVPASAAGPEPEPQGLWVVRDFSGGSARTRVAGKDFESTPYLVVLCSYNEDQYDDLLAGQALQRMLLTATARGLAVSPLSHVVVVAETRAELRRMLGGTLHPQSVLRVGYGSPTPPVPRQAAGGLLAGDP